MSRLYVVGELFFFFLGLFPEACLPEGQVFGKAGLGSLEAELAVCAMHGHSLHQNFSRPC